MARRPTMIPNAQREARQRIVSAAPLVSSHAGVEEVAVEMRFADAEGKQNPSPRGVLYAPHMHAYFEFSCPMRDCVGGGFNANEELQRALAKRKSGFTGSLTCDGNRPRAGHKNLRCGIELQYRLEIRGKSAA